MKDWVEQVLAACATIGVVVLFVAVVHMPRQRALEDLRKQASGLEQKLAQTQQRCVVLTPLTRQVEALRATAETFEQRLPRDAEVGLFLQQVGEQMRQAHLSSLEMRPASPMQGLRYTELPIRLEFKGTFPNIFAFLGQLEGLPRIKRIAELTLAGDLGEAGVKAEMVLSIFCAKG